MSSVYRVGLRMDGRRAVVVGGGAAAARRVAGLQAAAADVLLIEPDRYTAADLHGAWLVFACADDPDVNAAVAADAERRRLWCIKEQPARGRVLVLGGARSGKSSTAERFLADYDEVEYVATGTPPDPSDSEWAERVKEHRQRRPARWRTTETLDLEQVLKSGDPNSSNPAPVLIDCLSLWLARVMDECGVWTSGAWTSETGARAEVAARTGRLLDAWRTTARPVIAVSNEVGCGVVPATASGRLYRDALGRLNAMIAQDSDEVWFCTAGLPRRLR